MIPIHFNFVFAITILVIAILLGVLIYYRRKLARSRRALQELAQRFHGRISRKSMFLGDLLEGQLGGVPFTCRYFMGSRNSPPSLTIQISIPSPAKITIRRETGYDRFALRIGLAAELRTGDSAFDQAYFFDTELVDFFSQYLSEEAKRREIDALFSLGFPVREIVFGKKEIRIVLSPIQAEVIASVPLGKYGDALLNLSAGLASGGAPASVGRFRLPGGPTPLSHTGLASLFLMTGLLIPGGAAALAYGLHRYESIGNQLLLKAVILSAPAALLFLIPVYRWIRGRSSSHRLFPIVLILSLVGFPLAMTGGAVLTNGFLDQGAEMSRQVPVAEHYYRQSKNTRTYYVAFPSWQRPGRTDRISVPAHFFREVRRGDEIVIRTRPGYWKEEWIARMEKAPDTGSRPDAAAGVPIIQRGIRFYEGGPSSIPQDERHFASKFSRQASRFIYCQVDMENRLWQESDRHYTFAWRYINPDGSLLAELTIPFDVRRQWKTAWVSQSWGWATPGHWPPGDYRVIVLVDGRPFGEGSFVIK